MFLLLQLKNKNHDTLSAHNYVQFLYNPVLHWVVVIALIALSDLGGVPGACFLRVQILLFRHTKFRNVTASGVNALPTRWTGNPGSATGL